MREKFIPCNSRWQTVEYSREQMARARLDLGDGRCSPCTKGVNHHRHDLHPRGLGQKHGSVMPQLLTLSVEVGRAAERYGGGSAACDRKASRRSAFFQTSTLVCCGTDGR